MTALERALVVGPGRQRGRRADQSRDESGLREGDRARRFAKQMLRHRLDAVHAAAQVDPIQVELEDLPFRELRLDEERNAAFLDLPAERLDVREEERARELLRERASAFHAPAAP